MDKKSISDEIALSRQTIHVHRQRIFHLEQALNQEGLVGEVPRYNPGDFEGPSPDHVDGKCSEQFFPGSEEIMSKLQEGAFHGTTATMSPLEQKYGTLHERLELYARIRKLYATGDVELKMFNTTKDQARWIQRNDEDDRPALNSDGRIRLLINSEMSISDIHTEITFAQNRVDSINENRNDQYMAKDAFNVIGIMLQNREFSSPSPAFPTSTPSI